MVRGTRHVGVAFAAPRPIRGKAKAPVGMAKAFAKAVQAAEEGLAAGPRAPRATADASSPLAGFLWDKGNP